jgi:hypothetical protein
MVDRTTNTSFYPSSDPSVVWGKSSASNGDHWIVKNGTLESCMVQAEDDDDAIATASVSGSTITLALTDDAGANITGDTDIVFVARLKNQ